MKPQALVILDFSGTLSLGSSLFGRDESLTQALRGCGLWDAGVNRPDLFWQEVADPTWEEGSVTARGYAALLLEQALRLTGEALPRPEVAACVRRFVDGYLSHATVDPAWAPLLQELVAGHDTLAVVATDHYAEATDHVIARLEALGLAAARAGSAGPQQLAVANSADLGYVKREEPFWQRLRQSLGVDETRVVVLIDDFGFNEAPGDQYADPERVQQRRQQTGEAVANAFGGPVEIFPFFLEGPFGDDRALEAAYHALVTAASRFIRGHLRRTDGL